MVTYQQLHTLVILNISIVLILFIIGKIWKKASGFMLALISVCWLVCSWYYQLRLANHLPSDLHSNHLFLEWFLTIVFGFGCVLSIIATFIFSSVAITEILHSDKAPKKGSPNHSPLPLWIGGISAGLLSIWILKANMIPQLNQLMNQLSDLINVKLFKSETKFMPYYIPVAGIAAGTIVTACFTPAYRKALVPFVWFPSLIFVPVVTAVLAPLVEPLGCIMVIVLGIAAYSAKGYSGSSRRNPWLFILLALGIGCLSGLYFYANGLTILKDNKTLTIVGGIASGFTIACLGFRSYRIKRSPLPALYLLAFIPYCTPGFGSAVAFIINMVAAIALLIIGLASGGSEKKQGNRGILLDPTNAYQILSETDSFITFNDRGTTVIAVASPVYEDTYIANDGRMFQKQGDSVVLIP